MVIKRFDWVNLALPLQGQLYLFERFYSQRMADALFEQLLNGLNWQQERLFIGGRWVSVPRLMSWYGDQQAHYCYSGTDHAPNHWHQTLLTIKEEVEQISNASFNSVMANLYRNGSDSMGCHADNEAELGSNPTIASVSLGERRLLRFRHNRSKCKLELELGHGDLLIMAGELQHYWRHELPKTKRMKQARINLTFRKIISSAP